MLNKILLFLLLIISFNLQATTPADCANRASRAYESTKGSDYEKSSAGSQIASECFKEFSKSSNDRNDSNSFSIFAWLVIITISILLISLVYSLLKEHFRNATIDEIKEFLNRDLKHDYVTGVPLSLPFTEKMLEIANQKKTHFHNKLDGAITGKYKIKWRELGDLSEEFRVAYNDIVWRGAQEMARMKSESDEEILIESYKNKINILDIECPFCAEKIKKNAIKCKHCFSDLKVN